MSYAFYIHPYHFRVGVLFYFFEVILGSLNHKLGLGLVKYDSISVRHEATLFKSSLRACVNRLFDF